ncbi:hypothetical protein KUCAC02_007224 [Chaenocephalus aceratus]|uniref:Uncharacterized protein n=1 Tax=Chaenocephalus aceratus TaxID=36190 RepID=A0ACB9X5N0_CHAAC|nr:hypothetical protein KUCAC02_007224 [Chaenocephalus aceratus]
MVPGVDEEVLAVRHDGHSRVRLLLCERPTNSGKRGDPLVLTTQTLERVSPGKKGHQSWPRSALTPAYSFCVAATCGYAAAICSETRRRSIGAGRILPGRPRRETSRSACPRTNPSKQRIKHDHSCHSDADRDKGLLSAMIYRHKTCSITLSCCQREWEGSRLLVVRLSVLVERCGHTRT